MSRPHCLNAVICSFGETLVDDVQKHFMEVLCPLSCPAEQHDVELPGVVDDLKLQLLHFKVSATTTSWPKRADTEDLPLFKTLGHFLGLA